MMNIRQRSVNVNRVQLLEALRKNLEIHRTEYREAVLEFHRRLEEDLKVAVKKVKNVDPTVQEIEDKLKRFSFHVQFPQNYESQYVEVIEMLELSVDENINLDAESFRAYIKNEWAWQHSFRATKAAYATAGSFLANE
jgi:hypothetical protein